MAKRKLSARQIRWLFATGKLRASGKGKDRKVTYSKEGQAPKRAAIGGSKAAGLRSGSGKLKVDHSATRAARIAAGRAIAKPYKSIVESLKAAKYHDNEARKTTGLTKAKLDAVASHQRKANDARQMAQTQFGQLAEKIGSTRGKKARTQFIKGFRLTARKYS